MLELLIAILISLGCNVKSGATEDELRAENHDAYVKAESIIATGSYEKTEEGGVVILTIVGD